MKRGKHEARKALKVYGGFLSKSWQATWSHKQLWLIAAIAGLANTGAIFSRVINNLWRVRPASSISFESLQQSFNAFPWITSYFKALITLDTIRIVVTLFIICIIFAAIVFCIIAAQQIILHHAKKVARSKKCFSLTTLRKDLRHLHFWRIFSIDALVFLATIILQLVATIPLVYLLSSSLLLDAAVFVGLYLIILPLGFIINALGMFTLINCVRYDEGIIVAYRASWQLLKKHWLVIFELAIILYIINLVGLILLKLMLALLAVPLGLLTFASLSSGGILLMMAITITGAILAATIATLILGAMTMFNYSVWMQLVNRFEKSPFISSFEALAEKILLR
ncbi:MAG: hypothetical protein ABH826_02555 [Patescibacteria group bacterium]|nr:hypothetical protein [Patescibacteria group bacterium]